jgi:TolA-binding protein
VTGIEQWRQWVLEGKLREAEIELRLYLKQHPLDTEAHSLLADCQRKAGKFSDAVETYKNLIAIGSVSQANRARFKAGVLLQEKLRDHFGAASIFEEYLAAGNSSPLLKAKALVRLARSLIALNEKHRAKMLLERVISDHSGTSAAINAREILEQIQN